MMLKAGLCFMIYFLIFHALLTATTAVKRNYRIDVETLTCKSNAPEIIGDIKCLLRRDTDNIIKATIYFYLKQEINSFDVRHKVQAARKNTKFFQFFDARFNACEFLKTVHKQKYFQQFLDNLKNKTNAELKCPLKAHFNYTITDYYLDVNKLPISVPIERFRAYFWVYYKDQMIISISAPGLFHTN